jgi:hypothetical protein
VYRPDFQTSDLQQAAAAAAADSDQMPMNHQKLLESFMFVFDSLSS